MAPTLNTSSARAGTRTLAAEHLDTDLSGLFCTLKARAKLQTLVYDILPSNLEEDAGKRCSECDSKPGFASAKRPFYTTNLAFTRPSLAFTRPSLPFTRSSLDFSRSSLPFTRPCLPCPRPRHPFLLTVFVLAVP